MHVVGAAICRRGRCLVTRRSAAMRAPLKWEFPGGKVERGESPRQALRRELREELSVEARIGAFLGRGHGRSDGLRICLDVFAATILSGEPTFAEHAEHGWFTAAELRALDWPEADIPVLPAVEAYLAGTCGGQPG